MQNSGEAGKRREMRENKIENNDDKRREMRDPRPTLSYRSGRERNWCLSPRSILSTWTTDTRPRVLHTPWTSHVSLSLSSRVRITDHPSSRMWMCLHHETSRVSSIHLSLSLLHPCSSSTLLSQKGEDGRRKEKRVKRRDSFTSYYRHPFLLFHHTGTACLLNNPSLKWKRDTALLCACVKERDTAKNGRETGMLWYWDDERRQNHFEDPKKMRGEEATLSYISLLHTVMHPFHFRTSNVQTDKE